MRKINTSSFLLGFSLVIAACDHGWPPQKKEIVDNFYQNKMKLEALSNKLRLTKYFRANVGLTNTVHLDYESENNYSTDRLAGEQGAEWYQMFVDAKVYGVRLHDNAEIYKISENLDGNSDTSDNAEYVHMPGEKAPSYECKDEFRNLQCGDCVVPLTDHWWIYFSWFEFNPDRAAIKAFNNDEITYEEFRERQDQALEACFAAGAAAIGYPWEPWISKEGKSN